MTTQYCPITPAEIPIWDVMESIAINENEEPLVPVSISSKIKCYPVYYKMGVPQSIPECYVRQTVFEKLLNATQSLPNDVNLVVLDGWRPHSVQKYLYETFLNRLKYKSAYKKLSDKEFVKVARTIISPPRINIKRPSPHLTGGSVDVTLCDHSGRLLNMGTAFDENSPLSWTASLEVNDVKHNVTSDIVENRRILCQVMTNAGFTNLPSEWWHYDYGNQLWAYYKKQLNAIYGATEPMTLTRLWG